MGRVGWSFSHLGRASVAAADIGARRTASFRTTHGSPVSRPVLLARSVLTSLIPSAYRKALVALRLRRSDRRAGRRRAQSQLARDPAPCRGAIVAPEQLPTPVRALARDRLHGLAVRRVPGAARHNKLTPTAQVRRPLGLPHRVGPRSLHGHLCRLAAQGRVPLRPRCARTASLSARGKRADDPPLACQRSTRSRLRWLSWLCQLRVSASAPWLAPGADSALRARLDRHHRRASAATTPRRANADLLIRSCTGA